MEQKELLKKKLEEGFVPCQNSGCECREKCRRWLAREWVLTSPLTMVWVNEANPKVGGERCPMFMKDEKERMAFGFENLLKTMPRGLSDELIKELKGRYNRTYYYEYRNGSRPIPPLMQADIENLCRSLGYNAPVVFDRYEEGFLW